MGAHTLYGLFEPIRDKLDYASIMLKSATWLAPAKSLLPTRSLWQWSH